LGPWGAGLAAVEMAIRTAMMRLGAALLGQLLATDTGHRGLRIDATPSTGHGQRLTYTSFLDEPSEGSLLRGLHKMSIRSIARWPLMQLKVGYHRSTYSVGVVSGRHDPLVPPGDLHSVGCSEFVRTGDEFFRYFVELANLEPQESVLDIGCGTGRMARPLTAYLNHGSYDGIDIVARSIAWCQRTYTTRFPNFRFQSLDAYNSLYNPTGRCRASEYRFPFSDSTFNFIFLTSVFTHMLPDEFDNYTGEISRMLKPGGRCLITYFLLNKESLQRMNQGLANQAFPHQLSGCRIQSTRHPEGAVAYHESRIREAYDTHRLQIMEPIHFGTWSGHPNGLSVQDMVIARKFG
jgi:SAM-dependent methyltransferase